ncbi:MAG: DAK2 domain-containing protein [Clostridia bacterium]
MKILETAQLIAMFNGGYKYLKANKANVDALNVFPVPDGDTGTNMTLTMASAIKEINDSNSDEREDVLNAYARGALKGARGNSGVILSQIIKGLCKSLAEAKQVNTKAFASALAIARDVAYTAVTKPKEGTILTVIRFMAESAPAIASKYISFLEFFDMLIKKGDEILSKTPDMLPVLKKAGVVDAGGMGLLCVFKGYLEVLRGNEIPEVAEEQDSATPAPTFAAYGGDEHDLENIKFAYCTEYFVINIKKFVTEEHIEKLRDKLMAIGDCVIAIGDINFIKVHVHTNQPNMALKYALELGELDKVKIENMLEQNRAIQKTKLANKKDIGTIAICAGEGLAKIFKDLSIDEVIEGGQTMNPSVEDILNAVERINSDNIIILPNNGNIILAAEKVCELTKKKVCVIPSKEVAQGIHSAIAFDPEFDIKVNADEMTKAFKNVKCGEVTCAVRTTKLDGFDITAGDIIGLDGKKIIAKSNNVNECARNVVDGLVDEESEVVTLYYGDNITKEESDNLVQELEDAYPDFDIVCYYGGQPHYHYFISIE